MESKLFIQYLKKGTCIYLSDCANNFFVIDSTPKVCVQCDISCKTCNLDTPNNCTTCPNNTKILKKVLTTNLFGTYINYYS